MRIVAVAGAIGSGKSELSRALARALDASRVSFGDYVRGESEARVIEPTRDNLQALGEQLLAQLGPREFVLRTLAGRPPADLLIVDGVRHLVVDEELRKIAAQYRLIFVEVDDETRRRRLSEREGLEVDLATLDAHSTEHDVPLLRERASLIIDGADVEAAVPRVRELMA